MASFKLVKTAAKAARPVWLYPHVAGFNPSERWGHSACFSDNVLYVFGGCCGGLHFSDVLALDLKRMTWSALATTGHQPGTRDSHSAVLLSHKMIVFGGTNGSKKINDLHILDLKTRDWIHPSVEGKPPAPRESHSATLVDDNKLVVFGGSGEGEGNYLNDVHILDLDCMKWTSPEVKGELPARRDSHTAVAVGNMLIVYGGDCGDHYLGDVDILDLSTFTWSRLETGASPSPGVRAGHASVAIGSKVYVIGGVGDRAYYNDVWILDMNLRAWMLLDVGGPQPQGRFSHSAVLADASIVIYGGCGEDEHPLDEIIILHLGSDFSSIGAPLSMCKLFASSSAFEHRRVSGCPRISTEIISDEGPAQITDTKTDDNGKDNTATNPFEKIAVTGGQSWKEDINHNVKRYSEAEAESKPSLAGDDESVKRRRKAVELGDLELDPEQEEHSHSLSQQSSPSRSDQEQAVHKRSKLACSHHTQPLVTFLQQQPKSGGNQQKQRSHPYMHHFPLHPQHFNAGSSQMRVEFQQPQQQQQQKVENLFSVPAVQLKVRLPHHSTTMPVLGVSQAPQAQLSARDSSPIIPDAASRNTHLRRMDGPAMGDKQQMVGVTGIVAVPNLVGSEVRGTVDAVFDSGYLMTAQVNGQVFRGLLFSPGPAHNARDPNGIPACNVSASTHPGIVFAHHPNLPAHAHSAQHNPSLMNGAILGSPILPSVHLGTVIQPGNWTRSSTIAPTADQNSTAEAPGLHLGLMLKSPGSSATEMPRQVVGIHNNQMLSTAGLANSRGSTKGNAEDAQIASSHSLRMGTAVHTDQVVENAGHAPAAFPGSAGGHWVWHPVPPPSPVPGIVPLEDHARRSGNVHFVAVPPFPGFGLAQSQLLSPEMQTPIMRSGFASTTPSNGTLADLQTGVTLSLAGPGQGSQRHPVTCHKS